MLIASSAQRERCMGGSRRARSPELFALHHCAKSLAHSAQHTGITPAADRRDSHTCLSFLLFFRSIHMLAMLDFLNHIPEFALHHARTKAPCNVVMAFAEIKPGLRRKRWRIRNKQLVASGHLRWRCFAAICAAWLRQMTLLSARASVAAISTISRVAPIHG